MEKESVQSILFPVAKKQTAPKPAVILPLLGFNQTEQLMLAFQNRDERALEFLLSDTGEYGLLLGRKDRFIYEFLKHCSKLQQKYGELIIQTPEGRCCGMFCKSAHLDGFSVSVHSAAENKQLWVFSIICETQPDGKLDIWKCHNFEVDKTMV